MLIAVSVVSGHIEESHKRWKLEAFLKDGAAEPAIKDERFPSGARPEPPPLHWQKEGFRILGDDPYTFGPAFDDTSGFGGLMYILDLDTGRHVWESSWGECLATPSGFCFAGSCMYVADLEGSNIFEVDMLQNPGRLLRRISHPVLNDVHYVVRTRRGLLIASTGTDMVVELDLDGNSLYEWWAGDHGFTRTGEGVERLPERDAEHRHRYYHTRYHTTHLNAARYREPDERHLLVLLWRQGMLIEIDTAQPALQQAPRVILDGLSHPHSLRPLPDGGWMIADSQGERLVLLDHELQVRRSVPSIGGWIQDALPLPDDRWLVADVNNFRLLVQDGDGRVLRTYPFNRDWRAYGLEVLPPALASVFSATAGAPLGDALLVSNV